MEHIRTYITGTVGMVASGSSVVVSLMPHVETALRITSLLIGIAVGAVSLVAIVSKHRRESKKKDTEK